MTTVTSDAELQHLEQRWVRAELAADIDDLDAMTDDSFVLVGPFGFALDKSEWLDRYRSGALRTTALELNDVSIRIFADAAIAIGRLRQEARYVTQPANGHFRITQIAARRGQRWLLVGMHLSPIAKPPAGSAVGEIERDER